MWLKRASLHNTLFTRSKALVRGYISAICLYAAVAAGQSTELIAIAEEDQRLIQVSSSMAVEVQDPLGEFSLKHESRGDVLRFIAETPSGEFRSRWYDRNAESVWVVFATADRKFHEVESRLRVELGSPAQLGELAEELGALRAKYYEGLDYGVLWFEPNRNPIAIAKRLESDDRITRTRLHFKKPTWFPQ